jgi:hypothetical protein
MDDIMTAKPNDYLRDSRGRPVPFTKEGDIMDDKHLQKFDDTLSTIKFAPKELRDTPTVFKLAEELHNDIQQMQGKLKSLDDVLHKAMGSLLDAAHTINKQ